MENSTEQPSEWKEVSLNDLFSNTDLKVIEGLIHKKGLKEFLISKRQELESKGVLPEYLYYFLENKFKDFDFLIDKENN
jgi:hypothetical protein